MIKWLNKIWQTYVFDPLAGGNGKVQTSELAQWVLIGMIIRASYREGQSAEQVYPDIYWTMLFLSVCAIAAIKPAFGKIKGLNDENTPS